MYNISRVDNDMSFLNHVTKFVAATKKHRVSRGVELTICPCRGCKNKLLHEDDMVNSHSIRYGFVENYTVWKFHIEPDLSVTGASEPNSSTHSSVHKRGQEHSSSTATGGEA